MIIETYDIVSGNPVVKDSHKPDDPDDVLRNTPLTLEDVIQGNHARPTVFRCLKDSETAITAIQLSLQDDGLEGCVYSIYTSPTFIPNVSPGTQTFNILSGTESIPVTDSISDYVWIDVETPHESTGPSKAIFAISYDYS
jgi:hypothetical protein